MTTWEPATTYANSAPSGTPSSAPTDTGPADTAANPSTQATPTTSDTPTTPHPTSPTPPTSNPNTPTATAQQEQQPATTPEQDASNHPESGEPMNPITCPNCKHHINHHTVIGCTTCHKQPHSRHDPVCHLSPAGITNALIETERRIATASAAYHQVVLNERDLARAENQKLKDMLR